MEKYTDTELVMLRDSLSMDLFNLTDKELKELDEVEKELEKRGFKLWHL